VFFTLPYQSIISFFVPLNALSSVAQLVVQVPAIPAAGSSDCGATPSPPLPLKRPFERHF
jgi:hypothetical protein